MGRLDLKNSTGIDRPQAGGYNDCESLIHHFYRITFVHHAFHQDCTIDAGHTIVSLRYFLQYRRCLFSGVRIERDYHTARIPFQNRDDHLRPDLYGSTDKVVFGEAVGGR
jgi:hypothetical protein